MKPGWSRVFGRVYAVVLALATAFVLLDTFVIPYGYQRVGETSVPPSATGSDAVPTNSAPTDSHAPHITDSSYSDGWVTVTVTTYRVHDTDVHVADIRLADVSLLKTALANDTYGRNITDTTSDIASSHGAIIAVNGDFYGSRRSGYVIRDGVLYRGNVTDSNREDLCVMSDGSFHVITEGDISAEDLLAQGAWQVFSFGPAIVVNGEVSVTADNEVDKAMRSNPRTAIAQVDDLHYLMVVADGRTSDNVGLSLEQLAGFLVEIGAETAYNLDGGGSSTMYFNGRIINTPTSGHGIGEREVSDIVYI